MDEPLRRFRRPWAGLVATAWFLGLAVLVAGPLLGRGHLILLDFRAGPAVPRVEPFPLPSSGDLGNVIPLTAAHALLREIWTPLPEKLFLLLPVFVGGLGLYVLVRRSLGVGAAAAVFGGTLYVVNPFVWDRYLAGHVHFLLAYALLPWALLPLVRALDTPSRRTAVVVGVWLAALAAISEHIAGLYVVIVALTAAVAVGAGRARLTFAALAGVIGAILSAYWFLPFFFTPERRVGVADLAEYESRPDGFAIVPTLLSLYGFWREEFTRPVDERPALYVFLVPILALVVVGTVVLLRSWRDRRLGVLFVAAAALGVLLAAGTAFPPTEEVYRWLFPRIPFAGAYREPQKFLTLTVLAYAVLGAAGLERLREGRRWVFAATPIALASVLLYGHAMLWGLWGEVELSRYPESWAAADRLMERRGEGRLLVFPWELYDDWSFTDGRIVANPAQSYFSDREVLIGSDIGLDVPSASVDPFSYYVDDLLERDALRALGRELAPLEVRFVAWTEEADEEELQLLSRQGDLRRIYARDDLVLFENRGWRGDVMPLRAVDEREPYVESVRDASLPLVRRLPDWDTVSGGDGAIAVGERCNDGWRLGDERARCHRGAVAAFEEPRRESTLWRPFVGVQLLGYAITLFALALIAGHLRRTR